MMQITSHYLSRISVHKHLHPMYKQVGPMLYAACRTGKTSKRDVYSAVFGLESTAKKIFITDKLEAGETLPPGWEVREGA
jgi:hypothetical protein